MGLGDDIKQVASDVGGALGGVAADTAKAVVKTPLDILEEILGGKPPAGDENGDQAQKQLETNGAAAQDPAVAQQMAAQQKMQDNQQIQHHRTFMAQEQQHYQQKVAEDDQRKHVEEQHKEEKKKFEIKQLEKKKRENYQVQAAKDASNAEKSRNAGAG